MDTQNNLSVATRFLHWSVAILVMGLLGVGFYMATFEVWSLFPIHKALGVIALIVILPRVIWRLKTGWPVPASNYKAWEHKLSKLTHWVLILGTVIMPLSGFIFSGAGGHGVDVFGLVLAPENIDPNNPHHVLPFNAAVADAGHEIHEIVGYIMAVAIALHIVGAYKHHIIDKDRTLLRMLGK